MSKGLEALKEIKNIEVEIGNNHDSAVKIFELSDDYDECLCIIEKELKRLEEYDKTEYSALIERHKELLKEKKANEKKLKALEIIKEKRVEVGELCEGCNNLNDYNKGVCLTYPQESDWANYMLTKEEYDLLKEVLL